MTRQRAYPQTEREVDQLVLIALILSLATEENRIVIPASYIDSLAGKQVNLFIEDTDDTLIVEVEFDEAEL
jgi:hypothetical protein